MRLWMVSLATLILVKWAAAAPLSLQEVNTAQWVGRPGGAGTASPILIKAQVLLDRAHFSPGEIDGKAGENFRKAITAFSTARGLKSGGELSETIWGELAGTSSAPAMTEYTISNEDVRRPFLHDVPTNLEKMKGLPRLSYKGAREKLAEKFHMSEDLLQMLNPGKKFDVAGGNIVVANVETVSFPGKVARIEVDKSVQELKVFGRDQQLLAVYPATVGSEEKPAPTDRLTVTGISKNPTYRYNPKYAFKGVHAKEPFTINPGPNNPVGVVWIGLSAEGYGIHGTPDPYKVGKSESHGCVRLTNWDALRLAAGITKGTPVDFSGQEQVASESRRKR
jgi:lipoprotein-anchoring transpeptidase ErfK/SrfK